MKKQSKGLLVALLAIVGAVGVFAGAEKAVAHHAFAAEFDATQPIDVKGTVTKAKWVNPHSWLWFDAKNADGSVTNWSVEFGAPNALAARGLDKNTLKVGDEVNVKGYRSKNGGPFGYSVIVALADGRVFQTGGAQDAPGAIAAKTATEQAIAAEAAAKN
ncbi:MAG: hypothetical protein HZA63_08350 [Rhodocyclales bacterium]|nr:hypothetical protein [Rhodocyclales bacterium]